MPAEQNKAIIRRYYEELWNRGNLAVSDEIMAPELTFCGSLRVVTQGLEGFKRYVSQVRKAFPDFHNAIEDLIAEGDKVVAHLTYRGTHRGKIFGVAPTRKRVTYTGMALFRIQGGKIVDVRVNADTLGLLEQLGAVRALAPAC